MALVSANLSDDQQLQIRTVDPKKNQPIPPYFNMGRPGTSRHNIDGFDVYNIFSTLTGNSSRFFWVLAGIRDYETNLCRTSKQHMTPTEKRRIPRAYAELSQKQLVVRVSRETYLINPKVILPAFASFEKIWDKWKAACLKEGLPHK